MPQVFQHRSRGDL